MSKIYYAVKPQYSTITRYADEGDFEKVYDMIMELTDNHDEAANASSWCELASIGEIYESDDFTIEIIEDIE